MNDVVVESLCFALSDQAESARWSMADIPWHRIDADRAPATLRSLVREIAFSELTTTPATRRFLQELGDDTDFTQWISVWFFEETRHPQVLVRWLSHLGEPVDEQFLKRGRATAPFMKSRFGTLVTNVISELVASASYAGLAAHCEEPVLVAIARNLAADEARHAASFYAYAQRYLQRSQEREADRRDAIKLLYAWFGPDSPVLHPVSEFFARNRNAPIDITEVRARACAVVGALVDVDLDGTSDLLAQLQKGAVG